MTPGAHRYKRESKFNQLDITGAKPWKRKRRVRARLKRYLRRKERQRLPSTTMMARMLSDCNQD